MIDTLIDKQDNFEIVRDQIAAILVIEIANQQALASAASKDPNLWKLRIFSERSNPWEQFLNGPTDKSPLVNVWYDNSNFAEGASNISERQKADATINIDCYGYAVSSDNDGGGHNPGDRGAALEVQRAIRLVRNILMAAEYTYLGLHGLIWQRWPQSINVFQPQQNDQAIQNVIAARIALRVGFSEFSPQVTPETLELLTVDVKRTEDGEIVLEADYGVKPVETAFITTWVVPPDGLITVPTTGTGYDGTVDVGLGAVAFDDGDMSALTDIDVSSFGVGNTFTMTIEGIFPQIFFNGVAPDRDYILSVDNFGFVGCTSMHSAFRDCDFLVSVSEGDADLTAVTTWEKAFSNTDFSLTLTDITVGPLCTSLRQMYSGSIGITTLDVSNWRIDSVSTAETMISHALNTTGAGGYDEMINYFASEHKAGRALDEVPFGGGNSKYSYAGLNAYAYLTTAVVDGGAGWTITDEGLDQGASDISAATLGSELIVNGSFDTDTVWIKQTGWTIPGDGTAVATGANINTSVYQLNVKSADLTYLSEIVIDSVSGTIRFPDSNGATHTTPSTFVEVVVGGDAHAAVASRNTPTTAVVSSVSLKEVLIDY